MSDYKRLSEKMTNWKARCAELIDELHCYKNAHPQHDTDLIDRTRADLAQPELTNNSESKDSIAQIVYENAMIATAPDHAKPHWPSWADLRNSDARIHALNTADIILARWGRPAALPAPGTGCDQMVQGEVVL